MISSTDMLVPLVKIAGELKEFSRSGVRSERKDEISMDKCPVDDGEVERSGKVENIKNPPPLQHCTMRSK